MLDLRQGLPTMFDAAVSLGATQSFCTVGDVKKKTVLCPLLMSILERVMRGRFAH